MQDRSLHVSITAGTVVKAILIAGIAWMLFILRSIVLDVLTAITIASAIEPGITALKRYKIPRTLAVLIIYLGLFVLFFSIFYLFIPSLTDDIGSFIGMLPSYIGSISSSDFFAHYAPLLGGASAISGESLLSHAQSIFGTGISTANGIFSSIFSFIIIIVFSFYFAVIETGVDDFLRIIVPKSHQEYVLGLWRRSQHKIGLWMQGQLLLAVIMGVLVFLGLTILGVPNALVLAMIAACFEIIPVFGPILSAIPAVAIALASGGLTLGLVTVALYVIAQQFENHLIYPLVVTRVVGVPPLLVILALIVGAELAGFLGIILSVPVAATIQEFVRDLEHDRLPKRLKPAE